MSGTQSKGLVSKEDEDGILATVIAMSEQVIDVSGLPDPNVPIDILRVLIA